MVDGGLQKIQNLPEKKRKIILWAIVIVVAVILGYLWIKNFQEKIRTFEMGKIKNELNVPELNIPSLFNGQK